MPFCGLLKAPAKERAALFCWAV